MSALHELMILGEDRFDSLKRRLRRRLGSKRPLQIVAFRGYGTVERFEIRGRLLEDRALAPDHVDDSRLVNLRRMYGRMDSREVARGHVVASYGGVEVETRSNEEGYFELSLESQTHGLDSQIWHEVQLRANHPRLGEAVSVAPILAVPPTAGFAVISDIDDTIVETGADRLLEMLGNTFLKNAKTRTPFEGVSDFYAALQRGQGRFARNPIFYVSNGPWNLYDFLEDFMAQTEIPPGPLFMRDFGIDREKFIKDDGHKFARISDLLNLYGTLPFVLIGDSGERDPEIYREIVAAFPGRIRVIYIRDVTTKARDAKVQAIAEEVAALGVEMVRVPDTQVAADHARKMGLID